MVFSSLTFIYLFLPIVFLAYFLAPKKIKNIILLIAGIFFYAWGEPIYVLLMMLTITVDYTAGRLIDKFDNDNKKRTLCLLGSIIINLGILAVFKYSAWFVTTINFFGADLAIPQIALPIGISFYTFQSMSYTIDMYMRNVKVQKSYLNYATYVTLFPQIVAGPIVRYGDVQNEIDSRKSSLPMVSKGIGIFIRGLAKKVLLANNIGALWTIIKAENIQNLSVVSAWLGILAFTFQIYYDFSGYSDMAVGLGRILGFKFPENFNFPYISKSITEFWRRWHITLGSWFRSYVYIPLGGNRKGKGRTIFNLLVVWMLTGLWHGASWNFVLWGLYFGVILIAEKLFLLKWLEKLPSFLQVCYSFLLVVFGWVLFEFDSLEKIGMYFKAMFGLNHTAFIDQNALYWCGSYIVVFILCIFFAGDICTKAYKSLKRKYTKFFTVVTPATQAIIMLACTAYLVTSTYNPFLYFRF